MLAICGLGLGLLGAPGCSSSALSGGDDESIDGGADDDADVGGDPDAGPTTPGLVQCTGRAFTPPATQDWDQAGSEITVALGAAKHTAQDVLAPPGAGAPLAAKFEYGPTDKDLEAETVAIFVDDCAGWRDLGTAVTDGDGRAAVPAPVDLAPGVHEVRFVVRGDATMVATNFWALPVGTHLAVTDIDGTMTTSDSELFRQILDGSYVPVAYPASTDLTAAHVDRGHIVVYLTGRPYSLNPITRSWLADLDFVAGPLHNTDDNADILPTEDGVGDFKKAYLQGLLDAGYVIDLAYGNATTDIYAYLGIGLPAELIWIIGSNAGAEGTNAVTDSWAERAAEVAAGPPVEQPFSP